ncbi:holo-ACP synthase [Streptomyces sp. cg36]|uniref:holo-ACP synthase n=1 Tax=Streptomyces sp. cg36 TaxID=3238798 RepID=UPI0034E26104
MSHDPGPRGVVRIAAPHDAPDRLDGRWAHWLTEHERAYALGLARAEEHLLARRTAKEAVAELLALPGPPPWQEMEIRRSAGGAPRLHLSGGLAERVRESGPAVPCVSLTHARGYAAALAWWAAP